MPAPALLYNPVDGTVVGASRTASSCCYGLICDAATPPPPPAVWIAGFLSDAAPIDGGLYIARVVGTFESPGPPRAGAGMDISSDGAGMDISSDGAGMRVSSRARLLKHGSTGVLGGVFPASSKFSRAAAVIDVATVSALLPRCRAAA